MFGLIDCNNFFVSCERSLDKTLENLPVVVLSNNDGCVISRSNEAKALGIPMAAPLFKYRNLMIRNSVKIFSAKFELYNYRSQQVISEVKSFFPEIEVYSIDEVFFNLNGFDTFFDIESYCHKMRASIQDKYNIPTGIGIAPTKTLAKVANLIAKKFPHKSNHLYFLDSEQKIEKALKWLPIEDVWGIGRRLSVKMKEAGITKAYDLLQKSDIWVKQLMGVHGIRMINELKGIPQLVLNEQASAKQSIATTRSFMEPISDKEELRERLKTFAFACAEKLRRQSSCCKTITIFIQTNRFHKEYGFYNGSLTYSLDNPSSSSVILSKTANLLFEEIFKEDFKYKKAGVIVSDFVPDNERLISLFEKDVEEKHIPIMKAMDKLNKKYGKDKIRLASQSGKPTYERKILSPEYEHFLKNNTLPEVSFRFH